MPLDVPVPQLVVPHIVDQFFHGRRVAELGVAPAPVPKAKLTSAVIGQKAYDVIEIRAADGGWYDYNAKYAKGGSIHVLPAKLKGNIYQNVQELALKAHRTLGCRGVSRTDFRYDDTPGGTGELVVLEVNTQPGMTETSLVPELAGHAGLKGEARAQGGFFKEQYQLFARQGATKISGTVLDDVRQLKQ